MEKMSRIKSREERKSITYSKEERNILHTACGM